MNATLKNTLDAVLLLFAVFSATTAYSQEVSIWKFDLAPFYLWATNLEGDATVSHRQIALFESMTGQQTAYNTFSNGKIGFSA